MAVAPWGEVIALADHDEPAVLIADLDLAEVAKARAAIPALANARPFAGPVYVGETAPAARSAAE
jgi:predicted amidohydrolase